MITRDYKPEDLEAVEAMFRKQGFKYQFPDMSVLIEVIVLEADGKARMAVAARPTVELYFFGDGEWETPGMRLEAFKLVHEEMRKRLLKRGYDDAHAWLPPRIAKSFGRRLVRQFKWVKSTWACFVGYTGRPNE